MKLLKWIFVLCVLMLLSHQGLAWGSVDINGVWESEYNFGPTKEIMTANVQQIGDNLIGSFSVISDPSGEEYSGIAFGTVEDDRITAYYLRVKDGDGEDPILTVTFTDAKLVDDDKIQGTFYYHDSDLMRISGPYEAIKIDG